MELRNGPGTLVEITAVTMTKTKCVEFVNRPLKASLPVSNIPAMNALWSLENAATRFIYSVCRNGSKARGTIPVPCVDKIGSSLGKVAQQQQQPVLKRINSKQHLKSLRMLLQLRWFRSTCSGFLNPLCFWRDCDCNARSPSSARIFRTKNWLIKKFFAVVKRLY